MKDDGKLKIAITKEDADENFDLFSKPLKSKIVNSSGLSESKRVELLSRR